jgi:UDP-2,3-diacylglucosamine pyrophosphatase LpxH
MAFHPAASVTIPETIVISDFHIAAGALDDCDPTLERHICEFFSSLARRAPPIVLVMNGDFLDFVQADPAEGPELESETPDGVPLCFTEAQSLAKLHAIHGAHRPIFRSLGAFLNADSANELVVLPGNHDVDFFWPSVWREFVCGLGLTSDAASRVRVHLDQAFVLGDVSRVWIEHGHQYDPLNAFTLASGPLWSPSRPPVLLDREGVPRLFESIGTRFMIRFFNQLDRRHSFDDNIKPLCRLLATFGADAVQTGRAPVEAMAALVALFRFFVTTLAQYPTNVLAEDPRDSIAAGGTLARIGASMGFVTLMSLGKSLRRAGFPLDRPLYMFVADAARARRLLEFLVAHPNLLESIDGLQPDRDGSQAPDRTLELNGHVVRDNSARLERQARALLQAPDVTLVAMAHLHQPVCPSAAFRYANTGCWGTPFNAVVRASQTGPTRLPYLHIPPGRPEDSQLLYVGITRADCASLATSTAACDAR